MGTPLGPMALAMPLIGTTIGVGVQALGADGVSVPVRAAPQLGLEKVMDMDLDRDLGPGPDMGMEVGVVVLMVADMGLEVATVTLAVAVAVGDMAVRVVTSIDRLRLRGTKTGKGRKNVCE